MALKAKLIREVVEKHTRDAALNLVTGATDWEAVAHDLNENMFEQLDAAAEELSHPTLPGKSPVQILRENLEHAERVINEATERQHVE